MKSLLVWVGVILIELMILGYAEVWGADWKYYGSDELAFDYYDEQNIIRPSKDIVRVWVKSDYTKKGVMFWSQMERAGINFYDLNYSIFLWEINCLEKKFRHLSAVFYNNKKEPFFSLDDPSKWDFIIPDTVADKLYEKVCK